MSKQSRRQRQHKPQALSSSESGLRTREAGHALMSRTSKTSEDNWELRFPNSPRVYSKMSREDSQVTSVLKAISLPIKRADWRIDPNGAPNEIVALVSEDLRLPVLGDDTKKPVARRRGRVSWSDHLHFVLLSLKFGVMFFEQVYEVRGGRLHLAKLAPRFPGTLSKINVAADGGLSSIEQDGASVGTAKADGATIPVSHLVAYAHDPQDTSWEGTSVLRPAYKHWKLRDQFLRLEAQVLERNGMGVPVYKGTELTNDPKGDLEHGQRIVSELRAGTASGASIPAGSTLDIKGVSGQLVSAREAINYHDGMMAKAVLAHFLNLEGKGGSYALAETQSDLFIQSLQTTADWIADVATQHVVEDLVDVAFPEHDGLCPRIVVDPIASKKELSADDLSKLTSGDKPVIRTDKDLEVHVRNKFSLPAPRPFKDAVAAGDTAPKDATSASDADDLAKRVAAATALIRAGFEPEAALAAAGIDPVEHSGMEPVSVRDPRVSDAEGEVAEAEAEEAATQDDPGEPPGKEVVSDG